MKPFLLLLILDLKITALPLMPLKIEMKFMSNLKQSLHKQMFILQKLLKLSLFLVDQDQEKERIFCFI